MSEVATRLQQVRSRITTAALDAGRDPGQIQLLAVSKTFPSEAVREAFAAEQVRFGENRVQEAQTKLPELSGIAAEWHLIGHLQGNKARLAVELFDVIQTLDSVKIARRVGRFAAELDKRTRVYAQVDLGGEAQKSGIESDRLETLIDAISQESHLQLEGLMCIPPWSKDPESSRPYFRQLARLLDQVNQKIGRPVSGLSMGMSNDFSVAIEEGSTLVRVGTAIFGRRGRPD